MWCWMPQKDVEKKESGQSLKEESVGMEICLYKEKLVKKEIVYPLKDSEYGEV